MIIHVDMDAFYASVEERERPELVGRPVIVGGTPEGRGVVAAANYVVRKFGVHSAMPTSTALRLCPQAIVIPPRHAFYAEVSGQIRRILDSYTPLVEPLSLDEAFVDVTGCEPLFGSAVKIAKEIKHTIRQRLRLVASAGVAPNKFLAKIASDLRKPDGLVVVEPSAVQAFLDPLPIGRLWGVGRVTAEELKRIGISTIGQVRTTPLPVLQQQFGKAGEHFWRLAQGIDDRKVIPDREAKSISHETTFAIDLTDLEVLRAKLLELVEQVGWRVRQHDLRGRTVQLKVRFANFHTITRETTLDKPTNITREIWEAATGLLENCGLGTQRVRLLGVGLGGFAASHAVQLSLFPDEGRQKQTQLDQVADLIRDKFGGKALHRGSTIRPHFDRPESD